MVSMWGECPPADIIDHWRSGLEGYSGEQIKRALDRMLDIHPDWPPTLGQFRQLCKPPIVAHRLFLVDKSPRAPIPDKIRAEIAGLVSKWKVNP